MESKLIILEPASNLRTLGRAALRGNWQKAIMVMLILMVLLDLVGTLLDSLFGTTYTFAPGFEIRTTYSALYSVALIGALNVGLAVFLLRMFRFQDVKVNYIFAGFENFGKAFLLGFLITVFMTLWTLLFIIPGVIAYFRYSQAYYIMHDNPELSAMDCIRKSKEMMVGNKAKLFTTTLSFIGWEVLAMAPVIIYAIWYSVAQITDVILSGSTAVPEIAPFGTLDYVIMFVLSLGVSAVRVYYNTTCTAFYELLTGHLTGKVFVQNEYDNKSLTGINQ